MATATKQKTKRPDTFVYVSPHHPNTRFLVCRGEDVFDNDRMRQDKFAHFQAGICATKDPDIAAWLEAHSALLPEEDHAKYHFDKDEDPDDCGAGQGICMSAEHEQVGLWADQTGRKVDLSNRGAQLESGYDVEAVLRGENPVGGGPADGLMARAQSAMARATAAAEGNAGPPSTNHPERFHEAPEEE